MCHRIKERCFAPLVCFVFPVVEGMFTIRLLVVFFLQSSLDGTVTTDKKIIDTDKILSVIECEAPFIYRFGPDYFIGLLFRA